MVELGFRRWLNIWYLNDDCGSTAHTTQSRYVNVNGDSDCHTSPAEQSIVAMFPPKFFAQGCRDTTPSNRSLVKQDNVLT